MILLEFLWWLINWLFYTVTRPIIWIITARDCRHCKHSFTNHQGFRYCGYGEHPYKYECKRTPWRCNFERKRRTDNGHKRKTV